MASRWLNYYVTVGRAKSGLVMRLCHSCLYVYFFPPTVQLPHLGGLYHQGWQTTVTAQVSVCSWARTTYLFLFVLLMMDSGQEH